MSSTVSLKASSGRRRKEQTLVDGAAKKDGGWSKQASQGAPRHPRGRRQVWGLPGRQNYWDQGRSRGLLPWD